MDGVGAAVVDGAGVVDWADANAASNIATVVRAAEAISAVAGQGDNDEVRLRWQGRTRV